MPTNKSQVSKKCSCGSVQFDYAGRCLACKVKPFIPQQEEKGCCNHCVFNNGRDYKHADNCPCHSPQQECCEKCKCNNNTIDHQFVRGIHSCDYSNCPCHHSPQTESREKCLVHCNGILNHPHHDNCCKCGEDLRLSFPQSPNSGEKCLKCGMFCTSVSILSSFNCTPSTKEDWEESFKNEFYDVGVAGYLIGTQALSLRNGEIIKSFISQLITSTRLAEREKWLRLTVGEDKDAEITAEGHGKIKGPAFMEGYLFAKNNLQKQKGRLLQDNSNK